MHSSGVFSVCLLRLWLYLSLVSGYRCVQYGCFFGSHQIDTIGSSVSSFCTFKCIFWVSSLCHSKYTFSIPASLIYRNAFGGSPQMFDFCPWTVCGHILHCGCMCVSLVFSLPACQLLSARFSLTRAVCDYMWPQGHTRVYNRGIILRLA